MEARPWGVKGQVLRGGVRGKHRKLVCRKGSEMSL